MTSLLFLASAMKITVWVFAFVVAVILYRKLRLRTIPWLIAFFVLGLAATPISMLIGSASREWAAAETYPFQMSAIDFMKLGVATSLLESAAYFLVTLLVVSEVLFLVSNSRTAPDLGVMKQLLVLRDRVKVLGPALIVLGVSRPALFVMLYAVGP